MYYIRIGLFSVKTPNSTPRRFIISSITIKQQWLTLEHWACPLNNRPKDSGGSKKQEVKKKNRIIKKLYGSFLWMGFSCFKTRATLRRQFTFITLSSQKFLILILSTSEAWKAESTLEPPNGFDHETRGLGIQHLNH